MGSEQRRLYTGFEMEIVPDGQEEVKLGLREGNEPHPSCMELVLSPASPSPSGSVLS